VAGSFYPASPPTLRAEVVRLLEAASPPSIRGDIHALVAPHAGYAYSGAVAAAAYALLRGRPYEVVAVLSPSHRESFDFTSVLAEGEYQTPLGRVPVDRDRAGHLASVAPEIRRSEFGHLSSAGRHEHALEVHLPFLQVALGDFRLLPVVMGSQRPDSVAALASALAESLRGARALVVASSDLYHGGSYRRAWAEGRRVAECLERFDARALQRALERGEASACGAGPILAAMETARALGADRARALRLATSADAEGAAAYVVGYLSAVFFRGDESAG
jgi:AmmeMemoRadiSam system protein B